MPIYLVLLHSSKNGHFTFFKVHVLFDLFENIQKISLQNKILISYDILYDEKYQIVQNISPPKWFQFE